MIKAPYDSYREHLYQAIAGIAEEMSDRRKNMSVRRWEMEFMDARGDWVKVGFMTVSGFTPYRYELKQDAEWTLQQLHPKEKRRVVPAESVVQEKEHE